MARKSTVSTNPSTVYESSKLECISESDLQKLLCIYLMRAKYSDNKSLIL